jgi:hypothetical protein
MYPENLSGPNQATEPNYFSCILALGDLKLRSCKKSVDVPIDYSKNVEIGQHILPSAWDS